MGSSSLVVSDHIGTWEVCHFGNASLLGCCYGVHAAMVFCLGFASAYNIFVVVSEGGVQVIEISEFSPGKMPEIMV